MNYCIIGNSAAGLFAAEELRKADPKGKITILTADPFPSYSRCLTTYFLAGDIEEEELYLRTPEELAKLNLDIHYGCKVTELDPEGQKVRTDTGEVFEYDRCLIATGASAVKLDLPGSTLPEVFTLRNMEDAQNIKALLQPGKKAVIIGGGLVSLKSAYALRKQGLEVHVVVSSGYILSQMLNPQAAKKLEKHLQDQGIKIILNSDVIAIKGQEHVEGVELNSGQTLAADLVIIGKGVRPNVEPFRYSGLKIGQGILVNEYMETNLPNVYAAGDVAEAWDYLRECPRINAIWPNATEQGRIAALNMAGKKTAYEGSMGMNSVDFFGLRIISVGIIKPPQDPQGEIDQQRDSTTWHIEEYDKLNSAGNPSYQYLVWQGNILKGFVLLGDTKRAGILKALIQNQKPLSPELQNSVRQGKRDWYMALAHQRIKHC
ncbi:MAG: NAD(P)/FAD-dependent oxidoreductase [Desulfitobacterium sp.]|nr:NAD(P)/FAD-dependent oxidoreductase [Desulfitobacterium sp.]